MEKAAVFGELPSKYEIAANFSCIFWNAMLEGCTGSIDTVEMEKVIEDNPSLGICFIKIKDTNEW